MLLIGAEATGGEANRVLWARTVPVAQLLGPDAPAAAVRNALLRLVGLATRVGAEEMSRTNYRCDFIDARLFLRSGSFDYFERSWGCNLRPDVLPYVTGIPYLLVLVRGLGRARALLARWAARIRAREATRVLADGTPLCDDVIRKIVAMAYATEESKK